MVNRLLAAIELEEFPCPLAHSRYIQLIEELRANRIVIERREGRRVIYRLRSADLANWLVEGMNLLSP